MGTRWRYGYYVDATTTRVVITDSSTYTAQTAGIAWYNTDSASYTSNIIPSSGSYMPAQARIGTPVAVVPSGGQTLTAVQVLGEVIQLEGSPGAITINMPSAATLLAGMSNPFYNANLSLQIINSTGAIITLQNNTGLTFSGVLATGTTYALAAVTSRVFRIVLTNPSLSSPAFTVYG